MAMIEYIKNPDVWLSVIAIAVSVIALWQTQRQIKLSNKQYLFDRRLSAYLTIKDLLGSYLTQKENRTLSDNDEFVFNIKMTWYFLMGNLYLESVSNAIEYPISSLEGKEFSIKMVELIKKAEEIKLLFPAKVSDPITDFVSSYYHVVRSIYQYQLAWNYTDEDPVLKSMTIKEKAKQIGETAYRRKVLDSLKELDSSYQKIVDQDSEEQMKNCIRL
ncbi:MAG: hypothetical protein ACOX7G_02395 [Candidatus Scatomorpha sp.]|jgi:hypothetical protein